MAKRYEPKILEPKWQAQWSKDKTYQVTEDSSKRKIYATPMLPYPSGTGLHTGHVRNYSITDAVARYYRQKGFNTLSTIAWDAFGLPAENFAIKTGTPPDVSTAKNITYFKSQLQRLGMSYDWSREFDTSDPEYYRWTQWMFSLMYSRGLAYKAEKSQWWCEKCNTVLADEQVNASGKCWRHEGPEDVEVTKKKVNQWFFKITDYVDEILEATDALNWPAKIKTMQKNWIGKSKGAEISFAIANEKGENSIKVFTTRPDTLFGVTFLVLAPEHELVNQLTTDDNRSGVEAYKKVAARKDEIERQASKDKTGVFTGSYALNPINGERLPIWIADYVLAGYGTGAIMAVPAHDERDYEFATKYELPIRQVVLPMSDDPTNPPKPGFEEVTRDTMVVHLLDKSTGKYALLNWHESLEGITTAIMGGIEEGQTVEEAALMEIREEAALEGIKITGKLRWAVGARYCASHKKQNRKSIAWTVTAEINNLDNQGDINPEELKNHTLVWVDKDRVLQSLTPVQHKIIWEQLVAETVILGEGEIMNSGIYDGMSSSDAREKIVADLVKAETAEEKTTFKVRDWLISRQRYWGAPVPIIYCEEHGEVLVPENQLPVKLPKVDNYVPDGKNSSVLAGVEDWVNTTCPICKKPAKRETDTMDGYVCSTWYLHRYTDAHNNKQSFDPKKANYWFPLDFYFGGDHAVAHLLYIRFFQRVLCDAGLASEREPIKQLVYNGYINAEDGRKMSKSLGNTVDPMDIINSGYGADALRVFELFIAPYDQDTSWNTKGVPGTYRFLQRVWNLVQEFVEAPESKENKSDEEVLRATHRAVKKVTSDLDDLGFNTAVSAMMQLTNELHLMRAKDPITKSETWRFALESLTQLLGPFAPHIAEEMWHDIGRKDSVHVSHWPEWDEKYLVSDTVKYAVQVNGKLRGEIEVATDASEDTVVAEARANEKVAGYVTSDPKKVIFVKGKLVSFVV